MYSEVWIKKAEANDILNENVDPKDFNFKALQECYAWLSFPEYIVESVENTKETRTGSEIQDHYKVTTKGGKVFLVHVSYYFGERGLDNIKGKAIYCGMKNDRPGEEFYKSIGVGDKSLAIISFVDEEGNLDVTGKAKFTSLEIFRSVVLALTESFYKVGLDKIAVASVRIARDEEDRRLTLYRAIAERSFPSAEQFVDRTTEANEGYTILAIKL